MARFYQFRGAAATARALGDRFPQLLHARLESGSLYLGDTRVGERKFQLLDRERQIAGGDVVLGHVVLRIGSVACCACGQSRETDLLRGGLHVVEQVEQQGVRRLRLADAQQHLGIAQRQWHVARGDAQGAREPLARKLRFTGREQGLTERGLQHGAVGLVRHEFHKCTGGTFAIACTEARQGESVALCRVERRAIGEGGVVGAQVRVVACAENAHPLADEAVRRSLAAQFRTQLRGAIACLGDARARHRVGTQEFGNVDPGEPCATTHGLENFRHAARVEPGRGEKADTNTIGFVFVGTCEVDLLLHCRTLRDGDACLRGIRSAGRHADQDRRQHGRRSDHALSALCLDGARDVALRHVCDFVGEDAGELRFGVGGRDQSDVDADESAGQGKRIDAVIFDHVEIESMLGVGGLRGDTTAETLDVVVHLRIFEDQAPLAQCAHHRETDLEFVVERQRGVGPGADIRQLDSILGLACHRRREQTARCDQSRQKASW